jgi:hypothetical protein
MRVADSCGGLLVRLGALGLLGVAALAVSRHTSPPPVIWPCLIVLWMAILATLLAAIWQIGLRLLLRQGI